MSLRKSLGYSPIGEIGGTKSSNNFSFISDRSESFPAEKPQVVEREIPKKVENRRELKKEKEKKKVASYYLSVSLINKLKSFSDARGESYSSVVDKAITTYLHSKKDS